MIRHLLHDLRGRPTTVAAELRGAIATFLTMAYILPVNAGILSAALGADKIPALHDYFRRHRVLTLRPHKVHPLMYVVALSFAAFFAFEPRM